MCLNSYKKILVIVKEIRVLSTLIKPLYLTCELLLAVKPFSDSNCSLKNKLNNGLTKYVYTSHDLSSYEQECCRRVLLIHRSFYFLIYN